MLESWSETSKQRCCVLGSAPHSEDRLEAPLGDMHEAYEDDFVHVYVAPVVEDGPV